MFQRIMDIFFKRMVDWSFVEFVVLVVVMAISIGIIALAFWVFWHLPSWIIQAHINREAKRQVKKLKREEAEFFLKVEKYNIKELVIGNYTYTFKDNKVYSEYTGKKVFNFPSLKECLMFNAVKDKLNKALEEKIKEIENKQKEG